MKSKEEYIQICGTLLCNHIDQCKKWRIFALKKIDKGCDLVTIKIIETNMICRTDSVAGDEETYKFSSFERLSKCGDVVPI